MAWGCKDVFEFGGAAAQEKDGWRELAEVAVVAVFYTEGDVVEFVMSFNLFDCRGAELKFL